MTKCLGRAPAAAWLPRTLRLFGMALCRNKENQTAVALVEWINKEEACERLGKSEKTLERLVLTGEVESRLEPRPGRKPERLYHAASVERSKDEDDGRREERKAKALGALVPVAADGARESALVLADVAREVAAPFQRVPLHYKLWHTWDEASAYSGIPRLYVKQLAQAGKIEAQKFGRSWRVKRASLEAFAG